GPWRTVQLNITGQVPAMASGKVPLVSASAPQEGKASLVPEQEVLSEMPTQSVNTGPWRAVQPPAAGQSPSGKVPAVSATAPQEEKTVSISKEHPPVGSRSQSDTVKSSGEDLSSLVKAYSWWSQPGIASSPELQTKRTQLDRPEVPRESLRLADPDTVKWADDPSIPYSLSTKSPAPSKGASRKVNRRRAVAMLAAGGVAIAVGVAALNLDTLQHLLGIAPNQAQTQSDTAGKLIQSQTHTGQTKTQGHMGTVIGQTTMALNSANSFKNPADGQGGLLIHLPNSKFVAYERACTHEQVPVNYNPATKQLVCPAHGAIFDPANGGAVVQGPATKPLPSVKISVNGDGTITTI
ncbi:MAG TPA: Rieske 2Fe-2S domain-containing protein, partial [Ktedonobacteraceae bacterium]